MFSRNLSCLEVGRHIDKDPFQYPIWDKNYKFDCTNDYKRYIHENEECI